MRHRLHFHHLLVGSLEILANAHWKDVMIPSNGAGRTFLFISRPALIHRPWSSSVLLDTHPCHRALSIFTGPACHLGLGQIHGSGVNLSSANQDQETAVSLCPPAYDHESSVVCKDKGVSVNSVWCARKDQASDTGAAVLCVRLARIGTPREPPLSGGSHRKYLSISSFEGARLSHYAHPTRWPFPERYIWAKWEAGGRERNLFAQC